MTKRLIALALVLMLSVCLVSCSADTENAEKPTPNKNTAQLKDVGDGKEPLLDTQTIFTQRDMKTSYEKTQAVSVTLADGKSSCTDKNVAIDKDVITVKGEGIYVFSGKLSNGQLVVDAQNTDKIQLVLDGVTIANKSSAAIYVKQAKKVFITTAENTKNTLSTTGEFEPDGDTEVDGTIFSKDDITLCGLGELSISSTAHGIVSKDDLKITYGVYNVEAAKHTLSAHNCVAVAEGALKLRAGKDAIHSADKDNEEKGFVYIKSGSISAECESDGIDSVTALQIDDGSLDISAKGDGAKCDSAVQINNGKINISESDEGIEGTVVSINGGSVNIKSSDDGINASSDNVSSDNPMAVDEDAAIIINDGELTIDAGGDGIDSNGAVYVNGGKSYISSATNGADSALDYGSQAIIKGGIFAATGMSNMAENFSESSTQCAMLVRLSSRSSDKPVLKDSASKEIASFNPPKSYDSVVISTPDIEQDGKYTLTVGGESIEIEMNGIIYGEGGMQRPGGGMPPNGKKPDFDGEIPDFNGEIPDFNGEKPDFNGEKPDFNGDMPQPPDKL